MNGDGVRVRRMSVDQYIALLLLLYEADYSSENVILINIPMTMVTEFGVISRQNLY